MINYWTTRAPYFSEVRKSELSDNLDQGWSTVLEQLLPVGNPLKILDVGTGTGYFSILLARSGHELTGIDLTPAMIAEARRQAEAEKLSIRFEVMDAQELSFADASFDAVISRNLTWTLPVPEKAYQEWFRVLKKGGILINFDANYSGALKSKKIAYSNTVPYGHTGITPQPERENKEITLAMDISRQVRPAWDMAVLQQTGFSSFSGDVHIGTVILQEHEDPAAPIFLVTAKK